MTRYTLAAIVGAMTALSAWVLWVLAHAPDDTDPCDLCGLRVVPPTRSPHHPASHRKDQS